MFIPLTLLLSATVAVSGADTARKKAPVAAPVKDVRTAPSKPQPTAPSGVVLSGAPAAPSPSSNVKPKLLGGAIERSLKNTVRAVSPRATYLGSAIRRRASRGPALPPNIAGADEPSFHADSIVVEKSRHTMTLYDQGAPVRIYFIALGQNPVGKKVGRGDNRTPEGLYFIEGHNPDSKYHLSLRVSYPNAQDVAEARARGMAPGGDIMIHGLPRGFEKVGAEHRQRDWTNGCIAVTNAEIEEIWQAIPDGAVIFIKP
jgi:hypothetical protein